VSPWWQRRVQQQRRRALRRQVLHRDRPVGKARQLCHRARHGQPHCVRPHHLRLPTIGPQALHVVVRGAVSRVDAQHHRRRLVVGREQVAPVFGPILAHPFDPPQRVVERSHALVCHSVDQGGALAHEPPQHGIDEAGRNRRALPGCGDGLVDQRVVGIRRLAVARQQQRQRTQQQCVHRCRRRARRQPLAQGERRAEAAHDVAGQRQHAGSQLAVERVERLGQ